MIERLRRTLSLQPSEVAPTLWLFLYALAFTGGTYAIGRSVGRALFLSELPTELIAFRYILPPVVLVVFALAYTRITTLYSLRQVILVSNGIAALVMLVLWGLVRSPIGASFWVLSSLFVCIEVIATMQVAQFWTFAGEVFNARQARRLFGLIAAGATVGAMLGGLLLQQSAAVLATADQLWLLIASIGLCILAVWQVRPVARAQPAAPNARQAAATRPEPRTPRLRQWLRGVRDDADVLFQSPLMLTVAAVSLVLSLIGNIIDYQFDLGLALAFGNDSQRIAGFLGGFFLVTGLLSLLVQLLATSAVIRRLGLSAALLVMPVLLLANIPVVVLAAGALWSLAVGRGIFTVLRYTINDVAMNIHYTPLSDTVRTRARALLEGVVKPPVSGVLGLLFLLVGTVWETSVLFWVVPLAVLCGVWVWLLLRLRRTYVATLEASLQQRILEPTTLTVNVQDPATIATIGRMLHSHNPLLTLHTVNFVAELDDPLWVPQLRPLLDHPEPAVRARTVTALQQLGGVPAAERARLLADPDADVVATVVQTLPPDTQHLPHLLVACDDPRPAVRAAAVVMLTQHPDPSAPDHARNVLHAMLTDADAPMRRHAAGVLAHLDHTPFVSALQSLVRDPDPTVQTTALATAGQLADPQLLPVVLHYLGKYRTRSAASTALLQMGAIAEPALIERFTDPDQHTPAGSDDPRVYLARVLAQRGSPPALAALVAACNDPDYAVRLAVVEALAYRTPDRAAAAQAVPDSEALLQRELVGAYAAYHFYRTVADSLTVTAATGLLATALRERLQQQQRIVAGLFALRGNPQVAAVFHTAFVEDDSTRRTQAVELLDTLLDPRMRRVLLPLVEATPADVLRVAAQAFGFVPASDSTYLLATTRDVNVWLRCCALYALTDPQVSTLLDPPTLEHTLHDALRSPSDLVRETALLVSWRRNGTAATLALAAQQCVTTDLSRYPFTSRYLAAVQHQQGVRDTPPGTRPNGLPPVPRVTGGSEANMPLSQLEKVLSLKASALFAELPGEVLASMAMVTSVVVYEPGDYLIRQGDPGDALYIVLEGEVAVLVGSGTARTTIDRLTTNAVVGELALLTGAERSAHCQAQQRVVALRLEREAFLEVLRDQPEAALRLSQTLAHKLYQLTQSQADTSKRSTQHSDAVLANIWAALDDR